MAVTQKEDGSHPTDKVSLIVQTFETPHDSFPQGCQLAGCYQRQEVTSKRLYPTVFPQCSTFRSDDVPDSLRIRALATAYTPFYLSRTCGPVVSSHAYCFRAPCHPTIPSIWIYAQIHNLAESPQFSIIGLRNSEVRFCFSWMV